MAIETYLIEDSEKMISEPEHLDEWKKTVEELGLKGQKSLTKEDKSPCPFPLLNEGMKRVYSVLCPNKTSVKDYSNSTIPLRVLSLIALAEREHYFHKIEIWDDSENPDPIAVGYLTDSWDSPRYIIARWGDELKDFASLQKEAIKRWKTLKMIEWQEKVSELQSKIEKIELMADQYFKALKPDYNF